MIEGKLVGGTEADRKRLLQLLDDYLDVNARFDWEKLQTFWSKMPEAVFFNLNGHTYTGHDHWIRLWKYYKENVVGSYWTPFDVGGVVSSDVAVVWCHRHTKRRWVGKEPPPRDIHYDEQDFITRSTMAFRKEGEEWRVVHVHFSEAGSGARPGGI